MYSRSIWLRILFGANFSSGETSMSRLPGGSVSFILTWKIVLRPRQLWPGKTVGANRRPRKISGTHLVEAPDEHPDLLVVDAVEELRPRLVGGFAPAEIAQWLVGGAIKGVVGPGGVTVGVAAGMAVDVTVGVVCRVDGVHALISRVSRRLHRLAMLQ
jgi:hypothetical protein